MEHFGVRIIKRKYSPSLKRDEFALVNTKPSLPAFDKLIKENAYVDDSCSEYRAEWCEKYRALCLKNYDLNMLYFSGLDSDEFNNAIVSFLQKHKKFVEVKNLQNYNMVCGYYMMILDEYKQVYIGKSDNIKRRIQQNWSKTKSFDRTLFPMYAVTTSCFSIDFFRALDTTRIYVWTRALSDGVEHELVECFPNKFLTNRIDGDLESDGKISTF